MLSDDISKQADLQVAFFKGRRITAREQREEKEIHKAMVREKDVLDRIARYPRRKPTKKDIEVRLPQLIERTDTLLKMAKQTRSDWDESGDLWSKYQLLMSPDEQIYHSIIMEEKDECRLQ